MMMKVKADLRKKRRVVVSRKTLFVAFLIVLIAGPAWGETVSKTEKAVFASGCFWGVEKVFSALDGVVSTQVGYTGGTVANPTYEQVCSGRTGHAEAIEITYDPSKISYEELLEVFFRHHDPTTPNQQGNDIGTQYRSAVFYLSPEQKNAAQTAIKVLKDANVFRKKITTEVAPASEFYRAEEDHQKYLKKNPNGYCHILLQSSKVGEVLKAARAKA